MSILQDDMIFLLIEESLGPEFFVIGMYESLVSTYPLSGLTCSSPWDAYS